MKASLELEGEEDKGEQEGKRDFFFFFYCNYDLDHST